MQPDWMILWTLSWVCGWTCVHDTCFPKEKKETPLFCLTFPHPAVLTWAQFPSVSSKCCSHTPARPRPDLTLGLSPGSDHDSDVPPLHCKNKGPIARWEKNKRLKGTIHIQRHLKRQLFAFLGKQQYLSTASHTLLFPAPGWLWSRIPSDEHPSAFG